MYNSFFKQKDDLWLFVDTDGHGFIYPAGSCRLGIHEEELTIWIRNEKDAFIYGIPASEIQKSLTPDDFYTDAAEFILINAEFFMSSPKGEVSVVNSSTVKLDPGEVFTGGIEEAKDFSIVYVSIYSDKASAEDGLSIQQGAKDSEGIIKWRWPDMYSVPADTGKTYSFQAALPYFRIVYTNGIEAQTTFELITLFKPFYGLPNSHRLKDTIKSDDDAQLVKSVIAVETIEPEVFKNVDAQNPMPVDGDQVYAKDLLLDLSDEGDFIITTNPTATKIDILTSMVSDVHLEKKNDTANNPKSIILTFKRPVLTSSFGIDAGPNGDFSNTKITIFQGQASEVVVDESGDNTKHFIRLFPIAPLKFSKMLIEFHTSDTVTTGLIGIFKNIEVASRIQAISELTETVENINSFRGALKVDTALVHKVGVNLFFFRETGVTNTIAVGASVGDTSIITSDSTGFNIGDRVRVSSTIKSGQPFMFITDIVVNTLTLDRPLIVDLAIGDVVDVVSTAINVDGTLAAPVIFKIQPPNGALGLVWQLTRMMISIIDNSTMDDGTFGGIDALINGVVLRVVKGNGTIQELTNWKTNGDMALDMFDITYTDKAPAGQNGLRGRWTFTKAEFIVELDGANNDYFELLIQDPLSGLTDGQMKCQGRLFGG